MSGCIRWCGRWRRWGGRGGAGLGVERGGPWTCGPARGTPTAGWSRAGGPPGRPLRGRGGGGRAARTPRHAERLSLAELAALAGVHPVHLAATFRRHLGCPVGQYLRQVRIDQARRLLAGSAAPLAEVALAVG